MKDYTLGAEALGRGDDFDPRTDPIARVEASRLRSRLELYYATEGASDPVIITLPKGSYVPVFENRIARTDTASLNVFWRRDRLIWTLVALIALFATVEGLRVWQGPSNVVSGPEMRLDIMTPPTTDPVSLAISPDGQKIVFVATSQGDLRFTSNPEAEIPPIWSPRGDRLVFSSLRNGVFDLYEKPVVSTTGDARGKELFYLALDGQLVSVPLRFARAHQPESESHVPLFFAHAGPLQDLSRHYVVSADGRRFLIDTVVEEPAAPITIILNWKPPAD